MRSLRSAAYAFVACQFLIWSGVASMVIEVTSTARPTLPASLRGRWRCDRLDAEFVDMLIRSAIAGLHPDARNPEPDRAATKRWS